MMYFDNAATTRINQKALQLMNSVENEFYFNPSALYQPALKVREIIEDARTNIAKILKVDSGEVYFTSGATEANNWAIFNGYRNRKGNIVSTHGEHASVFECLGVLKNKGVEVRLAALNSVGSVDEENLLQLIDENTLLVSVIHKSNETGEINDIFSLSKKAKQKNKKVFFHSDGVQAFCKTDYPQRLGEVDLYSISGHKVNAAKGVGALIIKKDAGIRPYIYGGGQQNSLRSGTESVASIVGFGCAAQQFALEYDPIKISNLNKCLKSGLTTLEGVHFNTREQSSSIISISFEGVNAEILQRLLALEGIIIGLGSACAASLRKNRILSAMGVSPDLQAGSIRVSFAVDTTQQQVEVLAQKLCEKVKALRGGNIG